MLTSIKTTADQRLVFEDSQTRKLSVGPTVFAIGKALIWRTLQVFTEALQLLILQNIP